MSKPPIPNSQFPIPKKLRVCVVTGTRAEFGIWRPVLRAIRESKRLELKLVVTGMHLLPQFGRTEWFIKAAGHKADARVAMYRPGEPAATSLGRGIERLAAAYRQVRADLVMVLGDRLEMLAAASAALAERIPIAHVHGGETAPGIWDEQIRHAITKMAHLHFCATETARRRILRMGESRERVHRVGAPALDGAVHEVKIIDRMLRAIKRDVWPIILLHPSSASEALEYRRTKLLLGVLRRLFSPTETLPLTVIGPNNDPGHQGILRAYRDEQPAFRLISSASQDMFWMALSQSRMLIGNSSSGIIEAATLGVPVVNIGDRQAGRERNGNVIDVEWNAREIEKALRRVMTDETFKRRVARRKNVYGDGKASVRIVRVLEQIARDGGLPLEKRFVDA